MKRLMIAAAAIATLAAGAASAQTVDQRHNDQEHRIVQGERSGALTGREAVHLQRQQARIDTHEARLRARQGGRLTYGQRAHLQAREDRASANIYNKKHNLRRY